MVTGVILSPVDIDTGLIPRLAEIHGCGYRRKRTLIIGRLGGVVRHAHSIYCLGATAANGGGGASMRG